MNQAKNQAVKSSFEKTKEQFQQDIKSGRQVKNASGNSSIINFKFLIMLGISSITVLSILFLNSAETTTTENIDPILNHPKRTEPVIFNAADNPNNGVISVKSVEMKSDTVYETTKQYSIETKEEKIIIQKEDYIDPFNIELPIVQQKKSPQAEPYRFPVLNEEQRADNEKQKAKMLKQLYKKDKKYYVFIPKGSFTVDGKSTTVLSFWMRNTEITVLEYRTFLFDLLIQDRKNEFLKAKPDQQLWNKIPGYENATAPQMVENYFSHPAYDDYPVNNISREGAELFCKWLTLELDKVFGGKNQTQTPDVRIPTEYEWMYAAYGGHREQNLYPWNTNSLLKDEKCYLANFKPMVPDSTGKMVNSFFIDGGFYTVKADSYEPNDFGLYNMSGNVAEMVVLDKDLKTPAVKGGSWLDNADQLAIRAKAQNIGQTEGAVNIGFRTVISYLENAH